jgi:hypothetical protein
MVRMASVPRELSRRDSTPDAGDYREVIENSLRLQFFRKELKAGGVADLFVVDSGFCRAQTRVVKARLGILVGLVCLVSGCVAIPPLITVHHTEKDSSSADKKRIEELEQRVRELEQQQPRR